jgi:hypothetical protein
MSIPSMQRKRLKRILNLTSPSICKHPTKSNTMMRNYVPLEDDSRQRGHSRSLKAFCVLSAIMNLAALWLFAMSSRTACNTFQDVPYLYCEHLT